MFVFFKKIIKVVLFKFIDLLVKPNKLIQNKSLLLVRLDEIGDYVLFRNFIEIIKNSSKFEEFTITLLGNIAWKDVAEEFDGEFVENFIWVNKKKFNRNILYRYKKLKEVASIGYEIIINPTYSRIDEFEGWIVKKIESREKIASSNGLSRNKKRGNSLLYTKYLSTDKEVMFEFYRNKEFFQNILGESLFIEKPYLNVNVETVLNLPKKYAILFIGASADFRKWPIKDYAALAKFIQNNYELDIVLCGGQSEENDAEQFSKENDSYFINMVGKTSLVELIQVISKAEILISNETSAPHLAVAVGTTKIVVISNGNHYGRFNPYPKEITDKYSIVYPPQIENSWNHKELIRTFGNGSQLDITEITLKKVIIQLKKMLESKPLKHSYHDCE